MSISRGRCAALLLALVVSACASSAGMSVGVGSETASAVSSRDSRLIVRAQLAEMEGQTAMDAIERYKSRWLRSQRGVGLRGPNYARVVVNGVERGELDELRRLSNEDIESMEFLSAADATTKYGTGYVGGVIEVTLRRGN